MNRIKGFIGVAGIILVAILWCSPASAQGTGNPLGDRHGMGNIGANPFAEINEDEQGAQAPMDTVRKIRKPLESYFFDDSTRTRPNFSWTVDSYRNRVHLIDIDTTLNQFQLDYPHLKNDVGDAYLGNLGGATTPLNYFRRANYRDFEPMQAFDAYIITAETAPYYNVKRPFTHLSYYWAGQKKYQEETLNVIHAQNISPSTGFNINYNKRGTRGIYSRQKSNDKSLSIAFSHTGKKYSAHGGYVYNSVDLRENGGVQFDGDITDTIFEIPENVPVRLQDAKNVLKNNRFYVVQSYGIPLTKISEDDFSIGDRSTIYVGHSFEYSRFHKNYSDTKANSQWTKLDQTGAVIANYGFYDDWLINPEITKDSLFESRLSNRLFVQLQPWKRNSVLGVIDAGVGMDNHHYYQFDMQQYLTGNNDGVDKTTYYVYGSVEGVLKQYARWNADITYHPTGYRSQDLDIGGEISLSAFVKGNPITLTGRVLHSRSSPAYWHNNYYSNHFIWSNSFSKEKQTLLEANLSIPHTGTLIGARQSIVSDKIYYDANMKVAQHTSEVSVSGLYLQQDVKLGSFNMHHRLMLQWSSEESVIAVPMASGFLSYFFDFNLVKNVLRLQTGVDVRYNTKYFASGYNPALAQFYNQNEKKLGGYPLIDVFVTAKWKRMRIDIKMQHLNEDMFSSRDYFTVLHYPLNKRVLKMGVSWAFYD